MWRSRALLPIGLAICVGCAALAGIHEPFDRDDGGADGSTLGSDGGPSTGDGASTGDDGAVAGDDASGCTNDSNGESCAAATVLATPAIGTPTLASGVLSAGGEEEWFVVAFDGSADPQKTYHPSIGLTGDPGVVFDVYPACSGAALACGEGGDCTGKTSWDVFYAQGDPTGQTFQPIAPVGTGGQVFIRVYRTSGSASCDPFHLTVSNAGCGALNTVTQCGGCAQPCAATGASQPQTTATCTGTPDGLSATCSYTCAPDYLDCDPTAPDTNGCECHAPGATPSQCCSPGTNGGITCPTQHTTGLGTTFYDCNQVCASSSCAEVAEDACTAFTGSAAQCSMVQCLAPDGGLPDGGVVYDGTAWCATGSPSDCVCWTYLGPGAGHVLDPQLPPGASLQNCMCAGSSGPTFQ